MQVDNRRLKPGETIPDKHEDALSPHVTIPNWGSEAANKRALAIYLIPKFPENSGVRDGGPERGTPLRRA